MDTFTYFVAGDDYYKVALTLLEHTQYRIYLVMYQISLKGKALDLVETMANTAHKIPDVQFILNYEGNNSLKNGVKQFLKQFRGGKNIKVWIMEENTAHAKVLITDNYLLLGSTNYSKRGLGINYEANIITNDPRAIAGAIQWFSEIRAKATPVFA